MGHDDHHHGPAIPKMPDPTKYKIESSEYLMKVQRRLEAKGLKDPWLRNHVWRTDMHAVRKNPNWVMLRMLTIGWKVWVPLVIGTIAIESFLGIDYHAHGDHGDHGHGHGDKH